MTGKPGKGQIVPVDHASPDLIKRAKDLLAKAGTLQEVLDVRSKAKAYEQYFRAALHSRVLAQDAAEIRLRSERKAGLLLAESKATGLRDAGRGGDRKSPLRDVSVILPDLGVSHIQSHRWQTIANIPEPVFEKYIEKARQSELDELTTSHLMTIAKFQRKDEQAEEIRKAPPVLPEGPFSVIVADPPWPYSQRRPTNDSRGYPSYSGMTMEDIEDLPVEDLAADDAVLWLWTTNAFLEPSFGLCRAWGFQYRTLLTWAKNRIGLGDWLRGQTEHCILASRGQPLVTLKAQSTLLRADVQEHSKKPEEFYSLVEKLCPSPEMGKVELFARSKRPGWHSWGQEVERGDEDV